MSVNLAKFKKEKLIIGKKKFYLLHHPGCKTITRHGGTVNNPRFQKRREDYKFVGYLELHCKALSQKEVQTYTNIHNTYTTVCAGFIKQRAVNPGLNSYTVI